MPDMTSSERSALEEEYMRLREEHRDLDAVIEALAPEIELHVAFLGPMFLANEFGVGGLGGDRGSSGEECYCEFGVGLHGGGVFGGCLVATPIEHRSCQTVFPRRRGGKRVTISSRVPKVGGGDFRL